MSKKLRLTYCWGGTVHNNTPNRWNPNGNDKDPFVDPHYPILEAAAKRKRSYVYHGHLRVTKDDIKAMLALPLTIDIEDNKLDWNQSHAFRSAIQSTGVPYFFTFFSAYNNGEHMVHERCYRIWSFKDEYGLEVANELLNSPVALQLLS